MFYCGDTCQTIARGIGFRFEDIRSMFFNEKARQAVRSCQLSSSHSAMHVQYPEENGVHQT